MIQVYESDQAKGQWLVMGFDISRNMEGSGVVAIRQIGLMKVSFIKKNNEWMIQDDEFFAREVLNQERSEKPVPGSTGVLLLPDYPVRHLQRIYLLLKV